jgi:hypothetical protein
MVERLRTRPIPPAGPSVDLTRLSLMDSTIPVGMAACERSFEHAQGSDVLGARFEWNFGDASG